ncbi:hypothetical protein B0H16DRAFT_1368537 [Mycena metata]|uniref:Ubiquitin-like domain-containing protein n=1 Tax=Mycena metata TaxID=1033252 RepID=A0AAD7JI17_9AGAR|nr:hypothetical protein B0H16DRAFT_1368537 [Mycena metata]
MPKAKASARSIEKNLLVLTDGTKRVIIPRPKTYKAAADIAHRHFPAMRREDLVFQTDELEVCREQLSEITPESWETVVDWLSLITVTEKQKSTKDTTSLGNRPLTALSLIAQIKQREQSLEAPKLEQGRSGDKGKFLHLTFETPSGNLVVRMKPQTKFGRVRELLRPHFPDDSDGCRAEHSYDSPPFAIEYLAKGCRVSDDDTPASLGVEDGDDFFVYERQVGGKPVIYLFSPVEKEVTVSLTLTREWSFSAIYPVVPAKALLSNAGERIQWNVRTHPDGTLTELNTGLDVAYLFWEAHTNLGMPMSPPASPTIASSDLVERFSPLTCDLSPADSVLIAVADLTPYLDKMLLALGLHTEARTSFITYWLPAFLKHKHIALRFVPQAAYETAAVLDITPSPDVVTRVFMLFKGVPVEALGGWQDAKPTADDAQRWRSVVDVDVERAGDAALFRVLEWGGMEVLGGQTKSHSGTPRQILHLDD